MMEMKEQTGSRKKYLAPVVVLMLCLVTLTGAAYAYSASMSVNNNSVSSDTITIDLTGGNGPVTTGQNANIIAGSEAVTFSDNIAYEWDDVNDVFVKSNRVDAYGKDALVLTYKVTISGDAACNKLKVSSSDIATFLSTPLGNGKTVSNLFTVKVAMSDQISGLDGYSALSSSAVSFDITRDADAQAVNNELVYLYVEAVSDEAVTVNPATEFGEEGYKVATDFVTALSNLSFTISFEAAYI